jgi:hypothetical protein
MRVVVTRREDDGNCRWWEELVDSSRMMGSWWDALSFVVFVGKNSDRGVVWDVYLARLARNGEYCFYLLSLQTLQMLVTEKI